MIFSRRAVPGLRGIAVGLTLFQVLCAAQAVAAERRFLIDFGADIYTTPGWNNVTVGHAGTTLNNLVDSAGVSSGLTLQITDSFWQGWTGANNGNGTLSSTLYPVTATQDSQFIGNHMGTLDDVAKVRVSGLAVNGTYSVRLFGSRVTDDLTSDRTTVFTIGAQSVELQARNNVNGVAELTGLAPSGGALEVTVSLKPGAIYGYLGVLELIEHDGVVVNRPPVPNAGADRSVPLPTNTVALQQSGTDPEGQAITYLWTQVSGPNTARLYQSPWSPLVASNLVQGTYVFRLTATDSEGASATDDVSVSVVPSTGTGSPSQRTLTQKAVTANSKVIQYYESLPRGYNTDPNRKWPLIVYHHGLGQRGSTPESLPVILGTSIPVETGAQLEYVHNGVTESFIVLQPQLHESYGDWQDFFTQAMLDTARTNLRVDPDRVYLVGYSLGAFQTWTFPQRSDANALQVAAIAPVAGGRVHTAGGVSQLCRLANQKVAVWAFHAVDDQTVGVGTTDGAVNGLNACAPAPSPAPKYTRYADGDHWVIGRAVNPTAPEASNLYQWLLKQRRNAPPVTSTPRTLTTRSTTVPKLYNTTLGYYESLPPGYNVDPNRQWPLLVFLHGLGQRGNGTTELSKVLEIALPQKIQQGAQLEYVVNGVTDSFVVLMPQISASTSGWHPYHVERMLDLALANHRIDPKRIYLTGLSLGGFGTTAFTDFSLANSQRIAAIAPTDGAHYGDVVWAPDLGNVPTNTCYIAQAGVKTWMFYGAGDTSWGWTASQFVDRLNACTPAPALQVSAYAGVGHEAYGRAYETGAAWHTPNLYEWLLAQRRP
ncbi:PKD domain-containing protein [Corallococcus terminator]